MCGVVAVLAFQPDFDLTELAGRAGRMAQAIVHRGPDGSGIWGDSAAGIALAHRRLSILDLSPAGAQPMASASGRFTISFNGEIYNYAELRVLLPEQVWRGHSDTEVLLAAIEAFGVEGALARSVGMFAFALWDAQKHELVLARDRLGEKPLYYGINRGALLVASELKAIQAWPNWSDEIDRAALDDFIRHGYVHAPRTIYRGVKKLPPACLLRIPASLASQALGLSAQPYWSLEQHAARQPVTLSEPEALLQLDFQLARAIGQQMVADVPVGAFLSGGIDSSVIVALMQRQARQPVKTFSIGFREDAYNEAHHAKAVAAHLGTDHTELYVTPDQARAVIPSLPSMFDEPFADSSQIPTFLVAQLARRSVTVSLSGDGGDELFGGYNRYLWAQRIWHRMSGIPQGVRRLAGAAVQAVPPTIWDRLWQVMPGRLQAAQPGDKLHKLAGLAATGNGRDAYAWLVAQYRDAAPVVIDCGDSTRNASHALWDRPGRQLADNMMLADALGYLPDDILVKVDRATMAVSLEARAPFLDHRLVEFAFSLPSGLKIRDGSSKWLLRQLLYQHVPPALVDRPKMGFGVPIDAWLRGPLKAWAEALLDPQRLRAQGYLHSGPIAQAWQAHQSGRRNLQHFLWNVLMFQAWLETGAGPGA